MRNLNLLARDTLDFTQQTTVAGSAGGGGGGGMKNTKKKEKQWGKKENTRARARGALSVR